MSKTNEIKGSQGVAHTPGPWIATMEAQILAPNPQMEHGPQVEIAQVHNVYGQDGFCQTHGNACLIAAAPGLLEQLKVSLWMAINYAQELGKTPNEISEFAFVIEASAAIAAAEGRA